MYIVVHLAAFHQNVVMNASPVVGTCPTAQVMTAECQKWI